MSPLALSVFLTLGLVCVIGIAGWLFFLRRTWVVTTATVMVRKANILRFWRSRYEYKVFFTFRNERIHTTVESRYFFPQDHPVTLLVNPKHPTQAKLLMLYAGDQENHFVVWLYPICIVAFILFLVWSLARSLRSFE